MDEYTLHEDREFQLDEVLSVYSACKWSSASRPQKLFAALRASHTVVNARVGERLVGIGNAISDGFLVVYYPHLLVHPEFAGRGIGSAIMRRLMETYQGFHQQMLTADAAAIGFYEAMGFTRAGQTSPMWIYGGDEH